MDNKLYDFVAVGLGPFNLSLACLTEPIAELDGLFLEKNDHFDWHPGMLLPTTTLQVPFLADLVSLADPTSKFSFLNYLKQKGKIYSFYIRENFLVLRNEYNAYCQWATQQLSSIRFNHEVETIHYHDDEKCYFITAYDSTEQQTKVVRAKKLILGTGTSPFAPECCDAFKDQLVHSSAYLPNKERLQQNRSITILGSGQSAAEIYYDLLQDIDVREYSLHWITRSPRFFPLEYSKLTLEMTSPEYVDYFYSLPSEQREHLISKQKHLYKGINSTLINDIYDLLYIHELEHNIDISLRTNSELKLLERQTDNGSFKLTIHQYQEDKYYQHTTDALVMATGYSYQKPTFLEPINNRIKWDKKGRFDVNRNYSIDANNNEIFVQNAELHTHGFVTPDLGMGCYRNAYIIQELTGNNHYPIEQKIAFQQFGVSSEEEIKSSQAALEI